LKKAPGLDRQQPFLKSNYLCGKVSLEFIGQCL